MNDEAARLRIVTDLDTNLLVEAGAGSGKTTSLINRMLALIERGTPVERIAAVTFTRKAANELRERFQMALEQHGFNEALRDLDRAFIGTVHAFCGRLLRERPLEVGLDPSFAELTDEEWVELCQSFWSRWVERLKAADDPAVAELQSIGIDVRGLYSAFKCVVRYPDVAFPTEEVAPPDVSACRRALEQLLARSEPMIPATEPPAGWDPLMSLVRQLRFRQRVRGWEDTASFCDAAALVTESRCKATQNRWGSDKTAKTAAKELAEEWAGLATGPIADVVRVWREHRYAPLMALIQRAAADFEAERHRTARLGFADLLLLAARLLRENPAVRDELGARYRHLFVDEFQDTDPVQAEVCFLLASPAEEGNDWTTAAPRPGSLFVVGDPKQSIYRFRRADIQIYDLVRRRMEKLGVVLELTRNFRSVGEIGDFVNAHFTSVFPAEPTNQQAVFREMVTVKPSSGKNAICRYVVRYDGRESSTRTYAMDASALASWIAGRVESGERVPSDFLILTSQIKGIAYHARALSQRNIPVSTTGAKLPQEEELRELLAVLRVLADPENPVLVAAALEGLFFGLSPADLYDAHEAGARFAITHPPSAETTSASSALRQLHDWWKLSQREAADVVIERILDTTGLLAYAASQELGDVRAGALLHLVECVRAASLSGRGAITDAMSFIETLLTLEAPDTSLRPGRGDSVRVMNLHKAKGLEAPVVILASPVDESEHEPTLHVSRREGEEPRGGILLRDVDGEVIAQPVGWAAMAAEEAVFAHAELNRLLYVAATRAGEELVVGQCERRLKNSIAMDEARWRPLAPTLTELGREIAVVETRAPGRKPVERSLETIRRSVQDAAERVATASHPAITFTTVTHSVKAEREEARRYDLRVVSGLGAAWGSAVHRTIEGVMRGRRGLALDEYMEAVAAEEGLGVGEVASLRVLMEEFLSSSTWQRAREGNVVATELPIMSVHRTDDRVLVTEGVIDAATQSGAGWQIFDWKTDDVSEEEWGKRRPMYEAQVNQYAEMLGALTGEAAAGSIVRLRVAQG